MSRQGLMKEVRRLNELMDRQSNNVEIARGSDQIMLPDGMSYAEARDWLSRREEEEEQIVAINHHMECHPLDGSLALLKAIKQKYGWSELRPTPGFFGPQPPVMVSMAISPSESLQIPWGRMAIPGIHGVLQTGSANPMSGIPGFVMGGEIKKKHQDEVHELAKAAEKILEADSVYHRKALSIELRWLREERAFDPEIDGFKFLDVSDIDTAQLVFDDVTEQILNTTLFAFIEHPDRCRKHGIPLKRGILLEGPYGVGKTLTAYVTARKAVDNGWTFILVQDARDLDSVIKMARRYEPVVIFCEDIDRVVFKERTISVDQILNTIDGFQSKNTEVILVLTTNHVERLNKAMLRPGRLDTVVSLKAPDAKAAQRLIKKYGADKLEPGIKVDEAGAILEGQVPAVIREVTDRAKIAAIVTGDDDKGMVSTDHLRIATEGMNRHLDLLKGPVDEDTVADKQLKLFAKQLGRTLADNLG
jgi:transitional endoplasmic reticulum ATPase